MNHPGLDYAFLKYLGVSIDGEAALHGFYLPFLTGYARVLDLGCGLGGFVKLLRDQGADAYGVDADPQCIAQARTNQLPVVETDVVEHLRTLAPASLDAIFSAHLVEHMPYAVVLETIQLAHRALKPGGRLLLVTPNPRALVSHLELYHLHFAHVAFYHPKLLAFFMDYAGFARTEMGENPHTMPQYVSAESPLRTVMPSSYAAHRRGAGGEISSKPGHAIRRLTGYVKMRLANWLVRPYFDQTRRELNELAAELAALRANLDNTIEAVNRPFECYVIGDKAHDS